jgi:hypothetical protein
MQTRRFGKTGLTLSVFSLGMMRCLATPESAFQVLEQALQQGINHVETARAYGPSERYLGEALQALGQRPILTSKITPTVDGDELERQLEASLQDLGVDCLDCLAIHGINTPAHLEQVQRSMLDRLAQLLADGRIRQLGLSTHGPLAVIEGAIATGAFSFVNLHYYYFFQRNAPAIELAHQQDLGIFIISPADKGGLLYTPPERLRQLCDPFEPLHLTYRWLLSDPRITTLSLGPATPDELSGPLRVADQTGPPSAAEQQALDRLAEHQVAALGPERCSQCYACLPCPEAINIPEVLRLRNLALAYDMTRYGEYRYRMFEQAGHWFPGRKGNRCTDCGDCLPRCPEQLNIPTLLRDTHQRLNGPERRRLWS